MFAGLASLAQADALEFFTVRGKPLLFHEDHRWVLPMVFAAQEQGLLPRPVPVILFDRHTDAAEAAAFEGPLSLAAILDYCQNTLSPHDDDWIVAGIRMGLLADVLIFGVDDRMNELPKAVGDYAIMGRYAMPAKVSDFGLRAQQLLAATDLPILLDIDLDCFAYAYRERVLAWDEGAFEHEFGPSLDCFQSYVQRAGLITVCREHGCCGGNENADRIWRLARRYLFAGAVLPASADGP